MAGGVELVWSATTPRSKHALRRFAHTLRAGITLSDLRRSIRSHAFDCSSTSSGTHRESR